MFKKNSLKTTDSWKKLQHIASNFKAFDLKESFSKDPKREVKYSQKWKGLFIDYSKNLFSDQVHQELLHLAKELDLKHNINTLFEGAKINETENRSVLHTAFRTESIEEPTKGRQQEINHIKMRIKHLCDQISSNNLLGYTGKPIQSIVSIGIGGSHLGAKFLSEALQSKAQENIKLFFIANIDVDTTQRTLRQIDLDTTIFITISKTFSTLETITNFKFIKTWFVKKASDQAFQKQFYAITLHQKKAIELGFQENNCFKIWDWMGGRFSILGPVGLPIALQIGWENFSEILEGAHGIDQHFKNTSYEKNIPILLALVDFWQETYCGIRIKAIIPYSDALQNFPAYLQQLHMESNGKSVDWNGDSIDYHTQPIILGHAGTNVQHSMFQLFHQGTDRVSVEFIGIVNNFSKNQEYQKLLNSNLVAQSKSLLEGRSSEKIVQELRQRGMSEDEIEKIAPHKTLKGNKPSTIFFMDQLTPHNIGALIAINEHKVFIKGLLWNIYSFDQWGVEFGKECQKEVFNNLYCEKYTDSHFNVLSGYIRSKTIV